MPLLTVYVQSFKVDTAARHVLNANYISQQYIEKLDAATYPQALSNLVITSYSIHYTKLYDITNDQLQECLSEQKKTGERLGKILKARGLVTRNNFV